ncbi:hypothetical protein HYFRA_00005546 [Hymenoscyphus fraxineus]|uniref:polynucleotide adenylyltransferase n=1 Tax=Hymenoscyphus fraxineus TaxID=746836 RepID=A0A9N9KQR0_9HELO|nr:hypothetical protein HYFRA_00005546 [Hymenoscyphus fraxineus]
MSDPSPSKVTAPVKTNDNGNGGNLESRLRGLILSNANSSPKVNINQPVTGDPLPSDEIKVPPHLRLATPEEQAEWLENARKRRLAEASHKANSDQLVTAKPLPSDEIKVPPHLRLATPEAQAEWLENTRKRRLAEAQAKAQAQAKVTLPQQSTPHVTAARPGKRPNQAQRRQMNSTLSIPIDNSRTKNYNNQHSGFSTSPGRGSQWTHTPPHYHHQQNQYHQNQHQGNSPRFQYHGPHTPNSQQNFLPQNSPRSPVSITHNTGSHGSRQNTQHQPFIAGSYSPRTQPQGRQLYQPGPHHGQNRGINQRPPTSEELARQCSHLDELVRLHVPAVAMDSKEEAEKETFRAMVEQACRKAIASYEQDELGNKQFDPLSVQLQCFGSMMSGFATKSSDMDLALLSPQSKQLPDSPDSPIPRLLEKTLLDMGFGARLLTRTRVPIIKLCEKPTDQLRSDLIQAREKWEAGFVEETERGEDSEHIPPSPTALATVESYLSKLADLKQKHLSHLEYLKLARRVLGNVGGRDYCVGNPDLNESESKILHDVCKAYISGLSSPRLLERLKGYPSISPLFEPHSQEQPICRTLYGLSLQVEGERLAMGWDKRPLSEDHDARERECLTLLANWRVLQSHPTPVSFDEALKYGQELHILNDRLKRIQSLQLVYLEQYQHEEPFDYYSRAERIADFLRGSDRQERNKAVTPVVIRYYINGINSPGIREGLQSMSIERGVSLQCVALQHRIMQLTADYKHALKMDLFKETDARDIEEYIKILESADATKSGAIIISGTNSDTIKLISRVRTLPNPSSNRPRDRYKDHLEFPKADIGIQCDINFSAHLAIHNTLLLRCYSHCDPRVKQMVLFVKHWAKTRAINTPYRGSLSSYGYVLMVLHYLVNVAQPFVCPNLQQHVNKLPEHLSPAEIAARTTCNGCDVRFWRNESEIRNLADRKMLTHNHDSLGFLLRGFFEYYAQLGQMSTIPHRGFDYGREVLSLRTKGGILTKQEKGWIGAKTTVETNVVAPPARSPTASEAIDSNDPAAEVTPAEESSDVKNPKVHPPKQIEETKEIRHRYLFAIEDPFELDHNVARTVTHNGICAIREEFRRAWRIIKNLQKREQLSGGLLDEIDENAPVEGTWMELMHKLHGPPPKEDLEELEEMIGEH